MNNEMYDRAIPRLNPLIGDQLEISNIIWSKFYDKKYSE